ncbi:MAG: tRNA (guanosine(37)-N1)-methyltransferase TrmD [Patescibacteria group bacterium]
MSFDIITIFPKIFDSYFNESILKRAQKSRLIKIKIHNLRDFTRDKHHKVDDKPYGGGAGMVLAAEPIIRAVAAVKKNIKNKIPKIVIFSAKGKQFTQKTAQTWARQGKPIIFITGRYEGIDERVKAVLKAEEISIGPYVLTDGDVAAMAVISAVSRLLPGVIKFESLKEESNEKSLEYPHYTRPEILRYQEKKYVVPKVLLSGNHEKIEKWRRNKMK